MHGNYKLKAPKDRKPKPLTKFQQDLILKIENQPVQLSDFTGNAKHSAFLLRRMKVLIPNGDGMFGTTQTYRIDYDEAARRLKPAKVQGQKIQQADNPEGVPA